MKLRYLLASIACVAAYSVNADQLKQEITLDKDIVTMQRDVERILALPSITLPTIEPKTLTFSDYSSMVKYSNIIARLDAASYKNRLLDGPADGYITFGYFPAINGNFAAGYRFVDTDKTNVKAWLNFDSNKYKGKNAENVELDLHHYHFTGAASVDQRLNNGNLFYASARATFDRFNYPDLSTVYPDAEDQVAQVYNVTAGLKSDKNRSGFLDYDVAARYDGVRFSQSALADLRPIREDKITILADLERQWTQTSAFGLDLAACYARYTSNLSAVVNNVLPNELQPPYSSNQSKVVAAPYYVFAQNKFSARVGVRADLHLNPERKLHIAPDVAVGYRPLKTLGIEAKLFGEDIDNSLDRLLPLDIYVAPSRYVYKDGHMPLDAKLKVNVAPFAGVSVSIFGSYTIAKEALMPLSQLAVPYTIGNYTVYCPTDIRGFRYGAKIGYDYRRLVSVSATYQHSQSSYDRGYYAWLDRARNVVDVETSVRAIENLTIFADWQLRTGRAYYEHASIDVLPPLEYEAIPEFSRHSLKNINSLSVGATYALSRRLSAHATLNNILNHHYMLNSAVPAQGFNGLVGLSYVLK